MKLRHQESWTQRIYQSASKSMWSEDYNGDIRTQFKSRSSLFKSIAVGGLWAAFAISVIGVINYELGVFTSFSESPPNLHIDDSLATDIGRLRYTKTHADTITFNGDGSFDENAIKELCDTRVWQDGVYFSCMFNHGGLANVANMVLNCVRYSIEAGATGLLIPAIEVRDKGLTNLFTDEFTTMDYLFDEQHFRNLMNTTCPQLKLIDKTEDIPRYAHATMPDVMDLKALNPINNGAWTFVNNNAKTFRKDFDQWIQKNITTKPSKETPLIMRLDSHNLYEWTPDLDKRPVVNSFGHLVKFRPDCRALASVIVSRLMANATSNPTLLDSTSSNSTEMISQSDGYLGVHLRTEKDVPAHWPKFDKQADLTFKRALDKGLKHIYVATGDEDQFVKMRDLAAEKGLLIESKWTMLHDDEQYWVKSMTFDQEAEIDYLVLLKSKQFVGNCYSSFSTKIALSRHLAIDPDWKDPFKLSDSLSQLGGGAPFSYLTMIWP